MQSGRLLYLSHSLLRTKERHLESCREPQFFYLGPLNDLLVWPKIVNLKVLEEGQRMVFVGDNPWTVLVNDVL